MSLYKLTIEMYVSAETPMQCHHIVYDALKGIDDVFAITPLKTEEVDGKKSC